MACLDYLSRSVAFTLNKIRDNLLSEIMFKSSYMEIMDGYNQRSRNTCNVEVHL